MSRSSGQWWGSHTKDKFPLSVRNCIDRISASLPKTSVKAMPYRKNCHGKRGASLLQISPNQIKLTIKDQGVYQFLLNLSGQVRPSLQGDIAQIIRREGLDMLETGRIEDFENDQPVSPNSDTPRYLQESWLKQAYAKHKHPVVEGIDVALQIADDFNRSRKVTEPSVSKIQIAELLKAYKILPTEELIKNGSSDPEQNGHDEQFSSDLRLPTWAELDEKEKLAYQALSQATIKDGLERLVSEPEAMIKKAIQLPDADCKWLVKTFKNLGVLVASSKEGFSRLREIKNVSIKEVTADPAPIKTSGLSKATWSDLSPSLREAYLALYDRAANEILDDGSLKVVGPCGLLTKIFGKSTGIGRYGSLKKKKLLYALEDKKAGEASTQALVDIAGMPARDRLNDKGELKVPAKPAFNPTPQAQTLLLFKLPQPTTNKSALQAQMAQVAEDTYVQLSSYVNQLRAALPQLNELHEVIRSSELVSGRQPTEEEQEALKLTKEVSGLFHE